MSSPVEKCVIFTVKSQLESLLGGDSLGKFADFRYFGGAFSAPGTPWSWLRRWAVMGKSFLSCLQIFWEADIQRTLAEVDQYQFL